jgi:hypothetical protein
MPRPIDPRNFEVIDDDLAAVLRRKTPAKCIEGLPRLIER